ncbi:hypothetical protein NM09_06780 [Vibrio caribbeanicus]|uniref:Uncharacterized protein n=1 Tax=Vibrio caribbeanicus TaxID=701175 RepID=A0ACC4NXV6_9VIBR|nr:hypothetical protein [Vibrio caribbeanicus]KHD25426.1 hypothetical protein NM09_06780 [Vibrio caribbeanicus]
MNIPHYAKQIAHYISVERWVFDWNEVKSGEDLSIYRHFVSNLFSDENSISSHQRVRLMLGLEKKIAEVLIDCRTHSEAMPSDVIELVFIGHIEICLDTNTDL